MDETVSTTPLTAWHRESGASMKPFAGFEMPMHYGSIVEEHGRCRTAAALFDVSHMGRLRFDGERAAELLDHLLTRRVSDMEAGDVRYSLVCNAAGGIIDDVLISHIEKPSGGRYFLLVVNAANRNRIVEWLTPHLADYPDVLCTDRTESTAMIAVQGPLAVSISVKLFKRSIESLKYYHCLVTEQFRKPVIVSRTGYTGEDGLEIISRAEDAPRIWENLMLAGRDAGIAAAGLAARDTLRLEAGMPLYGNELSLQHDPVSAGLGFACNLKDRTFIGSDALTEIRSKGPRRVRVGLRPKGMRPARGGSKILSGDGSEIGILTSGTASPTLGYPIAMGYVDVTYSDVGTQLAVDIRGTTVEAEIVKLPFYRRAT